jgi:hypothetical protein
VSLQPGRLVFITAALVRHLIRIPANTVVVATDGSGQVKAAQVSAHVTQAQSAPIAAPSAIKPATGRQYYYVPAGCGDPTPAIDAATAALKAALARQIPAGQVAFGGPSLSITRGSLTCSPGAGASRDAPFTYVQAIDGNATQGTYNPIDVRTYQRGQLQQAVQNLGDQYALRDTLICPQGPQLVGATATRATVQCTAYGVAEWQWTPDALDALARSLAGKHKDEALRLLDATPGLEPGTSTIDLLSGDTLPDDPSAISIILVRPQDTAPDMHALSPSPRAGRAARRTFV